MERKVHPQTWTYDNIAAMKAQLKSMGLSLDWSREIATCDPAYYKHQQKMFLDFLGAGLVERKQSQGQLGPGRPDRARQRAGDRRPRLALRRDRSSSASSRSGSSRSPTIRRTLLDALDTLDRWPEKVRLMQKNWIGRSEGLLVRFALDADDGAERRDGARNLHHAAGHPVRREVHGARAGPSARGGGGGEKSGARGVHRGVQAHGTAQDEIDTAEKMGFDTGIRARASVRSELEAAGLCRELHPDGLRHRRHLRLSGARPARPRFRQQIRARQHAGRLPAGTGPEDLRHHRHRL